MRKRTLTAVITAMATATLYSIPAAQAATITVRILCQDKPATITSAAAQVNGTSGADVIVLTGATAQTVHSGAGDDVVCASSAGDTIDTGLGNDSVLGGAGNDNIDAGAGNDIVDAGAGNDDVNGGTGNDTINGGAGNDGINGSIGNDTIDAGGGNDCVGGGDGNDTLQGGSGNDLINAGPGADTINAGAGNDTINSGAGNDTVNSGGGNDQVRGDAGADRLTGSTGDDTISGGMGDDKLDGGPGKDTLDGNDGVDRITAGPGADVIHSDGRDRMTDRTDSDTMGDDSNYQVVPQAVSDTLSAAGAYLEAAIAAGDITATAVQNTLPDAPHVGAAPDAGIVTKATWTIDPSDATDYKVCVEGSTDAKHYFKYRARNQTGQPHQSQVTTGRCEFDYKPVPPSSDLAQVLNASAKALMDLIRTNTLTTPQGDQATMPQGLDTPSQVDRVMWQTNPNSPGEGRLCIQASSDKITYWRVVAQRHGTMVGARVFPGRCQSDQQPAAPDTLTVALMNAGNYLLGALKSGKIPASGNQAALPQAIGENTAPDASMIDQVTWESSPGKDGAVNARVCVSGRADGSSDRYRFMGGLFQSSTRSQVVPGGCNGEVATIGLSADQSNQLVAAGQYLISAVNAGDLTGRGAVAGLPDAPNAGAKPSAASITGSTWNVFPGQDHQAIVCVMTSDPAWSWIAKIDNNHVEGHAAPGPCPGGQREHD